MSTWEEVTLADLGRFSSGKPIVPNGEGQFKAYGSNGVIGHSEEARHDQGIIIGRVGAYCGSVAISHDPFWASDNTIVFEPIVESDLDYLYYLLRSARLNRHAGGSAQPLVTQRTLKALRFPIPDPRDRVRIGRFLADFDDLIENSRRRIDLLEKMARAIYHEWFVKFRYPGHEEAPMVESTLGPIPEGWEVSSLAAIAEVNGSSRKPTSDEKFKYLDIKALSEREIGELDTVLGSDAPGRARRVLHPGDTVWATVRPNRRAHALVVSPRDDWIASTGLAVLTPKRVSPAYLFETVSTKAFSDWLVGRATGSAYPAVRANDFEDAMVVIPGHETEMAYADRVDPMHALCWELRAECSALTELRDHVLPKLVTGQIDVSTLDLDVVLGEKVA